MYIAGWKRLGSPVDKNEKHYLLNIIFRNISGNFPDISRNFPGNSGTNPGTENRGMLGKNGTLPRNIIKNPRNCRGIQFYSSTGEREIKTYFGLKYIFQPESVFISLTRSQNNLSRTRTNHMLIRFLARFFIRFLARFLARVLTSFFLGGKTINAVDSTTRTKEKTATNVKEQL